MAPSRRSLTVVVLLLAAIVLLQRVLMPPTTTTVAGANDAHKAIETALSAAAQVSQREAAQLAGEPAGTSAGSNGAEAVPAAAGTATTAAPVPTTGGPAVVTATPFGPLPAEPAELMAFVRERLQWDRAMRVGGALQAKGLVTYQCQGGLCGGLGDRLYGMITSFYLAALTDRLFMIDMSYPVALSTYLEPAPGSTNWEFDPVVAAAWSDKGGQDVLQFIDGFQPALIESKDWRWPATAASIFTHGNLILANPFWRNQHLRERFEEAHVPQVRPHMFARAAIRSLFAPSAAVQAEVDRFWKSFPPSEYVTLGVQIRSGDRTTWMDPRRLGDSAVGCFARKVAEILPPAVAASGKKPLVFIATDSEAFAGLLREQLRAIDPNIDVATDDTYPRSHLDRPNGQTTFGAYARTFVDFFILAGMDHRLLSRSNFAYVASLYAPTGLGDLFYKDEDPTTPCKFVPFSIDPIANQ